MLTRFRVARRAGYVAICCLIVALNACSSDGQPSATSDASSATRGSPIIPGELQGSDTSSLREATDGPTLDPSSFTISFSRTTQQGYSYNVMAVGQLGEVRLAPDNVPLGQTQVTEAVDLSSFELTNTTGRVMDIGQDDLQIGGVGMLAAWPHGSKICDLFRDQYPLPDGRCGGGFAALKLQDDSTSIPADEPQQLTLVSAAAAGQAALGFQVDDTTTAVAQMRAALPKATLCLAVVQLGATGDGSGAGSVNEAACDF